MFRGTGFFVIKKLLHHLLVVVGAVALTTVFFFVLPLIQAISKPPSTDLVVQSVDTANLPPPPPPPEENIEEEEEPEEEPPELMEEAPPLDLSQLELALNPGFSDGWLAGDFAVHLNTLAARPDDVDALFSMSDLDQKPRAIYQPGPVMDAKMRSRLPGKVNIIFIVDRDGKVKSPMVRSSTDPVFDRAALAAVKKWKFEPGKKNGRPVSFRMFIPITFPKER
jgi:protein TonB